MEVLEAGPGGRPSRHRALLIALLAALAVVLAVAIVVPRVSPSAGAPPGGEPTPQPTQPTTQPRTQPRESAGRPTPSEQPQTWSTEPFPDHLDAVVFARSADSVFRIDTRHRRVTATRTPIVSGWLSFVAGERSVLAQQWFGEDGDQLGFVVPDDRPAQPLPAALRSARQVLPATAGRLWVSTSREGHSEVRLTDFSGRPVAGRRPIPLREWPMVLPDGRGGIWQPGTAAGRVVAVGAEHVLTLACRPQQWCRHRLLSRGDGSSRLLPRSRDLPTDGYLAGRISADGRYAAAYSDDEQPRLTVVDLRTGRTVLRFRSSRDLGDPASLLWLSDGRLLHLRDGRISVFDPATGRSVGPDLLLPRLLQLTVRG